MATIAADTGVNYVISAKDVSKAAIDSAVAGTKRVQTATERMTNHTREHLQRYRGYYLAAAAAVTALAIASRTEFKSFETALIDMAKVTGRNLGAIRNEIMALPPILGDATSLMRGYYQTISAGVTDPAKALALLITASKTAKAAHVEQEEVIKALTKMMAGYDGQIKSTADAADLLFAIEKEGQTTVRELVPIIGDISKASKEASINQYEMAAALSLITQTAGSTSMAATQYRGIVMGLMRPNEKLTKIINDLGFASGIAIVQEMGLADSLRAIRERAEKTGIPIGKLFESIEGMLGLASLGASSFETYKEKIDAVAAGAGSAAKAFDDWRKSSEAVDSELGANFKNLMIEIGTVLAPAWNASLRQLSETFWNLAEGIRKVREESLADWLAEEQAKLASMETLDLFSILGGVDTGEPAEASARNQALEQELIDRNALKAQYDAEDAERRLAAEQARRENEVTQEADRMMTSEEFQNQHLLSLLDNYIIYEQNKDKIIQAADKKQAAADKKEKDKHLRLVKQAAQAEMQIRQSVASSIITILTMLGEKHKAFAVLGIAIATAIEMARMYQATITASMLAFASQLIPGDPTSILRASAAAAATKTWGMVGVALIGAVGALRIGQTLSGTGSEGVNFGYDYDSSTGTPTETADLSGEESTQSTSRSLSVTIYNYGYMGDADGIARELVPAIRKAERDGV